MGRTGCAWCAPTQCGGAARRARGPRAACRACGPRDTHRAQEPRAARRSDGLRAARRAIRRAPRSALRGTGASSCERLDLELQVAPYVERMDLVLHVDCMDPVLHIELFDFRRHVATYAELWGRLHDTGGASCSSAASSTSGSGCGTLRPGRHTRRTAPRARSCRATHRAARRILWWLALHPRKERLCHEAVVDAIKFFVNDRTVSSILLTWRRRRQRTILRDEVNPTVVSVPMYFSDALPKSPEDASAVARRL